MGVHGWRGGQCGGEGGGGWGWPVGVREEGCRCCAAGGGESSCCAVAVGDGSSVGGRECLGCLVVEEGERWGLLGTGGREGSSFLVPGGRRCGGFLGMGGFLVAGMC